MMKQSFLTTTLVICSYFFSQLAMANSAQQINNIWQVSQIEGLAQTKSVEDLAKDKDWRNLILGENLTGPTYIRTGPDSRILLKHRNDLITIASSSLLKLEDEQYTDTGIFTKIIQTVGYALFDIEKNSGRRNVVETPYLVSVVKGTTFSVQVDQDGATVNLIEGRLLVKATQFDDSTIINQGEVAQLGKGDKKINIYSAHSVLNQQQLDNTINMNNVTQAAGSELNTATDTVNNTITSVNSVTGITGVSGLVGIPVVTNLTGAPLPPIAPIVADVSGIPIITDPIGNPIITDITGSNVIPVVTGTPVITDLTGNPIIPDITNPIVIPDVTGIPAVPTIP